MKISIVTVCFNAAATIRDTLASVASQNYSDIEHILIDGASTDNTMQVVEAHGQHLARAISEPDNGLYDAMNKGWRMATGEYVGFLHSDDFFADETCVGKIADHALSSMSDVILGDIQIVDPIETGRTRRLYSAKDFHLGLIEQGFAPPHPGQYISRSLFERHGGFDLQYPLASDFDQIARFLYVNEASFSHLPEPIVKMRHGGLSSKNLMANIKMFEEVYRSNKNNGIPTSRVKIMKRYFRKGRQFFMRAAKDVETSLAT